MCTEVDKSVRCSDCPDTKLSVTPSGLHSVAIGEVNSVSKAGSHVIAFIAHTTLLNKNIQSSTDEMGLKYFDYPPHKSAQHAAQ